jgi:hypothetical protein
MPICRSSGACEIWIIEYYKHPAPLALRSENIDSHDLLFAHSSAMYEGIMSAVKKVFVQVQIATDHFCNAKVWRDGVDQLHKEI